MKKIFSEENCIKIAKQMMKYIALDTLSIEDIAKIKNRMKYPKKWVDAISKKVYVFLNENPKVAKEDNIKEICVNYWNDNQTKYGKMKGYQELDKVLDAYFEEIYKKV